VIRRLALYGPLDPSFVGGIHSWTDSFLGPYCRSRGVSLQVIHTGTKPFEDGHVQNSSDRASESRRLPGLALPVYGGRLPNPMRLQRELRGVDLVYFDNGYALQDVAVLAAVRRRIPVISGFHSVIRSGNLLHDTAWALVGSNAVRRFDAVHALNATDAEYLASLGARNVMTIPLAVDTDLFAPRPLGDRFRITFLGRLHPQKGIERLVGLVTRLRAVLPRGVEFTIAGDGPLRAKVEDLKSLSRVCVLGSVDRRRAGALLGESAVVLMPSRYETFGYVAAEATSAGALVVANDIPALRDILDGTGALVSPLDTDAWVAAVARAYTQWMHQRAAFELERTQRHAWAATRYGFESIASQFDELLRRACRHDRCA
jgi:alpha-1,6-mannosyltransferase